MQAAVALLIKQKEASATQYNLLRLKMSQTDLLGCT